MIADEIHVLLQRADGSEVSEAKYQDHRDTHKEHAGFKLCSTLVAVEPEETIRIKVVLGEHFQWYEADRLLITISTGTLEDPVNAFQTRQIIRSDEIADQDFVFDSLQLYDWHTTDQIPVEFRMPHRTTYFDHSIMADRMGRQMSRLALPGCVMATITRGNGSASGSGRLYSNESIGVNKYLDAAIYDAATVERFCPLQNRDRRTHCFEFKSQTAEPLDERKRRASRMAIDYRTKTLRALCGFGGVPSQRPRKLKRSKLSTTSESTIQRDDLRLNGTNQKLDAKRSKHTSSRCGKGDTLADLSVSFRTKADTNTASGRSGYSCSVSERDQDDDEPGTGIKAERTEIGGINEAQRPFVEARAVTHAAASKAKRKARLLLQLRKVELEKQEVDLQTQLLEFDDTA
ncbi:unnamed protein product [Zymoseptoria tritici ST99CH_3D1]|uniref:Uncharacterized protein n=2 Tax=Zymoseptoria tritici TaxID=1047171 RepID=A0A1X7S4R3_ZYMT9|nr:unnamed protein product [Zymoseptoria tritici ST99CH_3D7]SMR59105.1 unnamed protein product [Zymoseptoria tritici ST99CH_1E4]SMR62942.1 unnamed protein product [Zymoseptoria tritici ST99CH_3D1]